MFVACSGFVACSRCVASIIVLGIGIPIVVLRVGILQRRLVRTFVARLGDLIVALSSRSRVVSGIVFWIRCPHVVVVGVLSIVCVLGRFVVSSRFVACTRFVACRTCVIVLWIRRFRVWITVTGAVLRIGYSRIARVGVGV